MHRNAAIAKSSRPPVPAFGGAERLEFQPYP